MENNKKIRVAITQGDTNGIGYELIFKVFADPEMLELCTPIIYGSPKVAAYYRNLLEIEANFTIISDASEATDGVVNLLTTYEEEVKVEPGVASETSGDYALKALDCALADYREGRFDVLVTNPIDNTSEFQFSGQSRYIEDHLETDGHGQTLMVDGGLRIALATRNLPLRQVVECITQGSIEQTCRKLAQSLRRDFRLSNPRIALLSINPKAGDNGLLGTEEQEIIRPAIETLTTEGIQAFGPTPPTPSSPATTTPISTLSSRCTTSRARSPSTRCAMVLASTTPSACRWSAPAPTWPTRSRWAERAWPTRSRCAKPSSRPSTFSATAPPTTRRVLIRSPNSTRRRKTRARRYASPSPRSANPRQSKRSR